MSTSTRPADLNEKRREVLESLSHGARLAEEVLAENEQLLRAIADLTAENARLRTAVQESDAIANLLTKIDELEQEKTRLLQRTREAQARTHGITDSVRDLEQSLNDLANLHVAAESLHSTLSFRGAVRKLNEILEQLVGVQAHVLYLGPSGGTLRVVASRGLSPAEREGLAEIPDSVREVASSGRAQIDEQRDASQGALDNPAALFPLVIDDGTVGVLSIVRSLSHKPSLTDADFQMFRFLGRHAAIAIMSAGLYASAAATLPPVDSFEYLES